MNLIYSIEVFSRRHSALFSVRGLWHQAHTAAAEFSHTQILGEELAVTTTCAYSKDLFISDLHKQTFSQISTNKHGQRHTVHAH